MSQSRAICVFCSSSRSVAPEYLEAARAAGASMARRGLTLVFGGASAGSMQAVADAAHAGGAKIVGVLPQSLHDKGLAYPHATELIVTQGLRDRKAVMAERSDAFLALPGGFGTLDEIADILAHGQLGAFAKPLVFLNLKGFYDPLLAFFDQFCRERFAKSESRRLYDAAADVEGVFDCIERLLSHPRPNALWPSGS